MFDIYTFFDSFLNNSTQNINFFLLALYLLIAEFVKVFLYFSRY